LDAFRGKRSQLFRLIVALLGEGQEVLLRWCREVAEGKNGACELPEFHSVSSAEGKATVLPCVIRAFCCILNHTCTADYAHMHFDSGGRPGPLQLSNARMSVTRSQCLVISIDCCFAE